MAYVKINFDPGRVMYLIIIDKYIVNHRDLVRIKPNEKFFDMVKEHVFSFIVDGKEPPEEIASAILNVSDDVMAGREVVIRAGDYISLTNFAKGNKII